MPYTSLDPNKIIETLLRLEARIGARFPESGLGRVCAEVTRAARLTAFEAAALARPNWGLRAGVAALTTAGAAAQIYAVKFLRFSPSDADLGIVQSLEAAVNLLILFGGAVWFLLSIEERQKRRRVQDGLHRLRSLAHVIDMHQLTKDPTVVLHPDRRTPASPVRAMSEFELTRYLDYCAEMLALIGKLAALYAERVRDPIVIDAVNDIENLAANLARKIWQKIMIIGNLNEGAASAPPSA